MIERNTADQEEIDLVLQKTCSGEREASREEYEQIVFQLACRLHIPVVAINYNALGPIQGPKKIDFSMAFRPSAGDLRIRPRVHPAPDGGGIPDLRCAEHRSLFETTSLTPSRQLANLRVERHQPAQQLKATLDYVQTTWLGAKHVDSTRIGAFGFSAGAFTALGAIGGVPDMALVADHCRRQNDHILRSRQLSKTRDRPLGQVHPVG